MALVNCEVLLVGVWWASAWLGGSERRAAMHARPMMGDEVRLRGAIWRGRCLRLLRIRHCSPLTPQTTCRARRGVTSTNARTMSSALGLIGLTPEEEATLVQLRETEGLQGLHMHEHGRSAAEPPRRSETETRDESAAPPEVNAALEAPPVGAVDDAAKDLIIAALEHEHGELRQALEEAHEELAAVEEAAQEAAQEDAHEAVEEIRSELEAAQDEAQEAQEGLLAAAAANAALEVSVAAEQERVAAAVAACDLT